MTTQSNQPSIIKSKLSSSAISAAIAFFIYENLWRKTVYTVINTRIIPRKKDI